MAALWPVALKPRLFVLPIRAQCFSLTNVTTKQAQVIKNIEAVLIEAGSSLEYIMKTTVFLANMSDYTAMNGVYASMLKTPKPARTAVEVGKLPGNFLVEIEAIAAIPDK